jgi:phosphonate transport system permease protein
MLEYNIRSASIVGYVGAGGIGVWLHTYQEFYEWDKFAAVLACILAAVIVLDLCGTRLRRTLAPTAP